MGVHAGPDISESGLVLALDVGNKKTFANSVINSTSWSLGSGSASGYGQNGSTVENERVTGTDPFGKSATVWETRPQGNNADDGGWNTEWYNIDNTKLYRFSVWVKRTTDTSGGTFYFGLYGNLGIRRTDNNTVEGNPYWDCRGTSGFVKDVWYLVVGHCYPYNTTYTGQHPESGIYTVAGGTTKVASINACNIGADVKWAGSDVTQTIHRCYHYYCADSTTRLQFFDPRIDAIDGTDPTIRDLLSGFTANRLTDLVGTNTGTFVNGPTYSSSNGGSIVFDGTNDFVLSSSVATYGNNTTWEAWVYCTANVSSYNMFMGRYLPYFGFYGGNSFIFSNLIGGAQRTINTPTNLTLNTWYHATFTTSYDGVFTTMRTYTNGVETASDVLAGAQGNYSLNFMVGDGNNSANNSWYPFQGRISKVKVYNRTLTASEVQQNFNANRSRFGI
jgi:hypothetical protein